MDIDRFLPARHADAELVLPRRAMAPYAPPAAPAAPLPPSDWQRYATAIGRHRWLVLAITLLGTLAGLVATRLLNPQYAARATLWIETAGHERQPAAEDGLVVTPSWSTLVTSQSVMEPVVTQLRLFVHPAEPNDSTLLGALSITERLLPGRYRFAVNDNGTAFELQRDDGTVVQRGTPGDTVGTTMGFAWVPPAAALAPRREVEFSLRTPADAAQQLARELRIRPDAGGSFVRLELRGSNAAQTTATLNGVAEQAVRVAAELKQQKFKELASILGEQYSHAQGALRSAEAALASFRVKSADLLRDRGQPTSASLDVAGDPSVRSSLELRLNVEDLRRQRRELEQQLAAMSRNGPRLDALNGVTAARESPPLSAAMQELATKQAELRSLQYRYTEQSAPVQQVVKDIRELERSVIPALVQQVIAELSARERSIAPRVDSAFTDLRQVPSRALVQARLERELANAEALNSAVGQRYEAARLSLLSSLPDIRVLDAANVPHRPVADYAPLLIGLAFFTSLILAVLVANVRDRVDPRLRHPEQVTQEMRLPILGAIPLLRPRRPAKDGEPFAEALDAFRGLRLRVLHAHGIEGPVLLTITSPAAGEGKSFVSLNLSLAFAYAGYRTLLIDGDVRRGGLHSSLRHQQRPGLTDVLAGEVPMEEAIHSTSYPGLSFMSSGTRMHRAPELLMSPRLRELIDLGRDQYGVVIVDSPPLVAGIDPLVLATATGNMLCVLRSGATDLSLASAKIDVADTLPVRVIGAVLNAVRGTGAFRYYTYDASDYQEVELPGASRRDSWRTLLGGKT